MHKLLTGIVDFQKSLDAEKRRQFTCLALGQKPDAFLVACCDSRVAANVFASTQPGDLFVVRNVGNLVPRYAPKTVNQTPRAVGAALEYAMNTLNVRDIIVCGHSQCGAMLGALAGIEAKTSPHLVYWLKQVKPAMERLRARPKFARGLAEHNRLSQMSVLVQLENLRSYPMVAKRVEDGDLRLHGWWFDLEDWRVLGLDKKRQRFVPIDKKYLTQHAMSDASYDAAVADETWRKRS